MARVSSVFSFFAIAINIDRYDWVDKLVWSGKVAGEVSRHRSLPTIGTVRSRRSNDFSLRRPTERRGIRT